MKQTLIIGDTHGHILRLETLLKQEGILAQESGNRVNTDIQVIHIGDLGHFGVGGSPTGDRLCWEKVGDWIDLVCWGNHDYPVFTYNFTFSGYQKPDPFVQDIVIEAVEKGYVTFATSVGDHLITHAGLHPYYQPYKGPASELAQMINNVRDDAPVIRAVGPLRGGFDYAGGILWRDSREEMAMEVPQIFGHTAFPEVVRKYDHTDPPSFCIDVGMPDNGRLAGIWLPSMTIAEVNLEE